MNLILAMLLSYFWLHYSASLSDLPVHALAIMAALAFTYFDFKKAVLVFLIQCFLVYSHYDASGFLLSLNFFSFIVIAFFLLKAHREPQLYMTLVLNFTFVLVSELNLGLYLKWVNVPDLSLYPLDLLIKVFVNLLLVLFLKYLLTQLDRLLWSKLSPYFSKSRSVNLKKMRGIYSSKKPFGLS